MYCKYLSRQLNGKLRCKKTKHGIILGECLKCLKFEPRKNKAINKVSKKRIFVEKKTYEAVDRRDNHSCRLRDSTCEGYIELHHIYYRSERPDLINEPRNCIMLCTKHHQKVHSNKGYWQQRLLKMNKFEGGKE